MSSHLLRLALAAALVLPAGCGTPAVGWKTFVDTGVDEIASALVTDGADLYAVGSQVNPQTGRSLWLVQCLNRKGELVRRFPLSAGRAAFAADAAMNRQGDLYVCGRANPRDTNAVLLARFRREGIIRWQRGLVVGEQSRANGMCLTDDGRVIICGAAVADQKSRVLVAAFDTTGRSLWQKTWDLGAVSEGWRIAANADGMFVVTGRAGIADNPDIFVMKLSPTGESLWSRRYDSGGDDIPGDITWGVLDYALVTGTARGRDSTKCVVLVYDRDGMPTNLLAWGRDAQAEGHAITATPGGEYFVTGRQFGPKGNTVIAFQYLADAVSVWERTVAIGSDGIGAALVVDGDVFVAATVRRQTQDIAVLRLTRPVATK